MIAKLRGVSNPAQVADNLLARFSLTDAANQRADQYSGGMKRRLDIAMSLIGAPAVIFLTNQRLDLILKRESKCGIQSRNLLVAVQLFCLRLSTWRKQNNWQNRIAILHGGKIITTGTLAELKEMFPPAKVEYIEKQPTLEEIFLAIIGKRRRCK